MPSSYTASLRFEKQFTGENVNVWGDRLNTVLDLIDVSVARMVTVALTADYSLTSVNGTTDEARYKALKFTGTGAFTVTTPSVAKTYIVWNACTGAVTLTTGGGTTVAVGAGETALVLCDGTNFRRVANENMGARELLNLAEPTASTSAATRAYVDAQAWAVVNADLPSQVGNSGKFLTTDGTTPDWQAPTVAQISDYASDQTTKHAATLTSAKEFAIAMAVAL